MVAFHDLRSPLQVRVNACVGSVLNAFDCEIVLQVVAAIEQVSQASIPISLASSISLSISLSVFISFSIPISPSISLSISIATGTRHIS